MNSIWQFGRSNAWIEPFLFYAILFFFIVAVILFLITILSRQKKIRKEHLDNIYETIIEEALMMVLFNDKSFNEVIDNGIPSKLLEDATFREKMMKSVILLHQNYEGIYAKKIENFYFDSRLIKDSFEKLKNPNWEIKCKGIMEVSEMNIYKSFDSLVKISKSKNKILKITALNACIKLNGTNGILHLINHKHRFDTWTQINIIDALKRGNIEDTNGIERLLTSKNKSVVSLGLKIIQSLKLSENLVFIEDLIRTSRSQSIQKEARAVLENISVKV